MFTSLSIYNFTYFLTDKQKTKKGREIQITQILRLSITISYFLCALGHCIFGAKIQIFRHFWRRWNIREHQKVLNSNWIFPRWPLFEKSIYKICLFCLVVQYAIILDCKVVQAFLGLHKNNETTTTVIAILYFVSVTSWIFLKERE